MNETRVYTVDQFVEWATNQGHFNPAALRLFAQQHTAGWPNAEQPAQFTLSTWLDELDRWIKRL